MFAPIDHRIDLTKDNTLKLLPRPKSDKELLDNANTAIALR